MRTLASTILLAAGTISALIPLNLRGGGVRASFLQDTNCLRQTVDLLVRGGCSKQGAATFESAVHQYFQEPFDFDFAKFPRSTNGTYWFPSPQVLVAALPHRLAKTQHTFDLNCFDTAILLAHGRLETRLHPDDIVGPILTPFQATNGESVIFAATLRDAFNFSNPAWYQAATEGLLPKSMQDDRICLTASLFRWHVMPMTVTKEDLGSQVLKVLRAAWQRERVQFPEKFNVVLLHNATVEAHTFCTCHAGLLFQQGSGFTYIEKAGGCGPFVRLDFTERSDLMPWLATAFTNYADISVSRFATFNDRTVSKLIGQ